VPIKICYTAHQGQHDRESEQVGSDDPRGPLRTRGAEAPLEIIDDTGQHCHHYSLVDSRQEYAGTKH